MKSIQCCLECKKVEEEPAPLHPTCGDTRACVQGIYSDLVLNFVVTTYLCVCDFLSLSPPPYTSVDSVSPIKGPLHSILNSFYCLLGLIKVGQDHSNPAL